MRPDRLGHRPGLAWVAVGARVNGTLVDLDTSIEGDAEAALVAGGMTGQPLSDDALFQIRHSAAHATAAAIRRIVPEAQLMQGPPGTGCRSPFGALRGSRGRRGSDRVRRAGRGEAGGCPP
jgi:hypothetical protein